MARTNARKLGGCLLAGAQLLSGCTALRDFDFQAAADAAKPDAGLDSARLPEPHDGGLDGGEIDGGEIDAGCMEVITDQGAGIFVSPQGVDTMECRTALQPCKSLAFAQVRAQERGLALLYLDQGVYEESMPVRLAPGLTWVGGYERLSDGRWARRCAGERTATRCEDAGSGVSLLWSRSPIGVLAEYDGGAELHDLAVCQRKVAEPGESQYAIFARGSGTRLVLRDVLASAAAAGDGDAGAPGATPAATFQTCDASTGREGAPGDAGVAARRSTAREHFEWHGYLPAQGGDGTFGRPGQAGSIGVRTITACNKDDAAGRCGCTLSACPTSGPMFTPIPQSSLAPGQKLVCSDHESKAVSLAGGRAGCGGAPGSGGRGGAGGGSSFGVFAFEATVTVEGGSLSSGRPGRGGQGGSAGPGGEGSPGGAGETKPCHRCEPTLIKEGMLVCRVQEVPTTGHNGGMGGRGGAGGAGGAGADGLSYPTFAIPNGNIRLDELRPPARSYERLDGGLQVLGREAGALTVP